MPTAPGAAQWTESTLLAAAASPVFPVYDAALDMWGWSEIGPGDGVVVYDYLADMHGITEFETVGLPAMVINGWVVVLPPQTNITVFRYLPGFVLEFSTFARNSEAYQIRPNGVLNLVAANEPRDAHYIGGFPHLLLEPARTNVVLHSRDLTNAAWVKTNCTALKDQAGADGVASAASKLTATAGNATCLQSITLASSARYQSAYVKRITGTGVVEMTMDNVTWTPVTVTASWTRVTIPTQTLANPTVGFRIVTSGDEIAVDFVQNEDGSYPTSRIATTTAAVTRAADNLSVWSASFTSQEVTQYERWYDLATSAYLDSISVFTGASPQLPQTGRAYTHIHLAMGTQTLDFMQTLAGTAV